MHNFDAFEENYPAEALGSEVCDGDGTGRRERMISSSERSASRPRIAFNASAEVLVRIGR